MDKQAFRDWFCSKRNVCGSSGVTTYYNLRKLYGSDKIPTSTKWVTPAKLKQFESEKAVTKKNLFASLVAYLKAAKAPKSIIERASKKMVEYAGQVQKHYTSQKKTEKQKVNWVDMSQIQDFYKEKTKEVSAKKLYSKADWTPPQRRLAEQTLMLALHGGSGHPPPRLEYSGLVYTKDGDFSENKNYLYQKNRGTWRARIKRSKVSSKKGIMDIKFTSPVARVLNKMKKFLTIGRPVFQNKKGGPLTRSAYSKRLRALFAERFPGKQVGAGLLRTIFLSDMYKGLPSLKIMDDTAKQMMHSTDTALGKYVKKN